MLICYEVSWISCAKIVWKKKMLKVLHRSSFWFSLLILKYYFFSYAEVSVFVVGHCVLSDGVSISIERRASSELYHVISSMTIIIMCFWISLRAHCNRLSKRFRIQPNDSLAEQYVDAVISLTVIFCILHLTESQITWFWLMIYFSGLENLASFGLGSLGGFGDGGWGNNNWGGGGWGNDWGGGFGGFGKNLWQLRQVWLAIKSNDLFVSLAICRLVNIQLKKLRQHHVWKKLSTI